jgi:hypothetical protein
MAEVGAAIPGVARAILETWRCRLWECPDLRLPNDRPARRNSLTFTPFLTNTVSIAPAHAGLAASTGAPSTTRTGFSNFSQRGWVNPNGRALTYEPSLPFSTTV